MTVGEILDRAFKILPQVIKSRIILVSSYCAIEVVDALFSEGPIPELKILSPFFRIASAIIGINITISSIKIGHKIWTNRGDDYDVSVSSGEVWRLIRLGIRVGVVGTLYLLLFVIPGLVYFTNRILSVYILIIEKTSIKEALEKSKLLMTGEKWYKLTSPTMRLVGFLLINLVIAGAIGIVGVGGFTYSVLQGNFYLAAPIGAVAFFLLISASIYNYLCMLGFYEDLRNRYLGADLVEQLSAGSVDGGGVSPDAHA